MYETPENWGICREECKGDAFEPSNENNLDGSEDLWDTDIYDLRFADDCFCHTYNPTGERSISFDFQMGLFLGHLSKNSLYRKKN